MSGSRLVRGTRSRLFLYVAVVVVVGMAVYVFHGAQLQLDDARKVADKCQQQQESLSAQLQGKNSLLFNCTYKLQLVNYLFFSVEINYLFSSMLNEEGKFIEVLHMHLHNKQ